MAAIGFLNAKAGRSEPAREALRQLDERAKSEAVPYVPIHFLLAALDERARLYASLEKRVGEGTIPPVTLRYAPTFDPFREDPEFQALMARTGA
jgi:hypothetical protein